MEPRLERGFLFMENKVRLVALNTKEEYNYWTSISITSELNTLARSFLIGVTAKLPNSDRLSTKFKVGDPIQVYIDDDLVLSGYIDATPISYDSNSVTATISGRSKTEDLVDCNPLPEGQAISFSSSFATANTRSNNLTYASANVTSRSFTSETLGKVIATLVGGYGIKLKANNDSTITTKLAKKVKISVDSSKTVHEIIKDQVVQEDLTLTDDENGDLVIIKLGFDNAAEHLTLGKNIKSARASFDGSKLFSLYKCLGNQKGTTGNAGFKSQTDGECPDNLVTRNRYKILKAENNATKADCDQAAQNEAEYQRAQFKKVTYTVVGWRQFNGELWCINQKVQVDDDLLDLHEEMVIQKVTYSLSSSGTTTQIEVVPIKGIKIEIKKGTEKNTKPKKSDGFSSVKLERNKY